MYLSVHRPSALSGHSAQSALSHRAVTFPCHTTYALILHNSKLAFTTSHSPNSKLTLASLSLRCSPLPHFLNHSPTVKQTACTTLSLRAHTCSPRSTHFVWILHLTVSDWTYLRHT